MARLLNVCSYQEDHCKESRASRDDEALSKRDCYALRARNDNFFVISDGDYFRLSEINAGSLRYDRIN